MMLEKWLRKLLNNGFIALLAYLDALVDLIERILNLKLTIDTTFNMSLFEFIIRGIMAIALTVVFRQYYKMSDETKQLKQFILDSKLDHKLLIFTIKTNTNINMEDVDENLFRKEFSKNEIIRLKQLYPSINVHIK